MVAVHIQISGHFQLQIKKAMSRKTGKHMVKKADARIDVILSASVQIQFQRNVRFSGFSVYYCFSFHDLSLFFILFFKAHRNGIGMGGQLFCLRKADDVLVHSLQGILGIINNAGTFDEIIHAKR